MSIRFDKMSFHNKDKLWESCFCSQKNIVFERAWVPPLQGTHNAFKWLVVNATAVIILIRFCGLYTSVIHVLMHLYLSQWRILLQNNCQVLSSLYPACFAQKAAMDCSHTLHKDYFPLSYLLILIIRKRNFPAHCLQVRLIILSQKF